MSFLPAPYAVVCFVLLIKDRHNGNLLFDDQVRAVCGRCGYTVSCRIYLVCLELHMSTSSPDGVDLPNYRRPELLLINEALCWHEVSFRDVDAEAGV